jgi:hypothetical protein
LELEQFKLTQGMMLKMYEFKKQNRTIPNDMEGLMQMIKESGGFSKEVNSILKKKHR